MTNENVIFFVAKAIPILTFDVGRIDFLMIEAFFSIITWVVVLTPTNKFGQ